MYQGKTLKLTGLDDGVVELTFDLEGESVNKFSRQTVIELEQALDALASDKSVTGLIVTSAKPALMVGADITEFQSFFAAGEQAVRDYLAQNNRNFCRLEDLPFPVVIAISGYALGGGMELCLACDYRIATEDTRIGLPETTLGIIPGWGGTVRLPRLVGVDTAAEWIASGRQWDAKAALKAGVVDALVEVDQLRAAALHTLAECRAGRFDYRARRQQKTSPLKHNRIEAAMAFETAKSVVAAQAGRHYPAPVAAIEVMREAAGESRDAALEIEAKTFARLATTPVAQALVGIFISDQLLGKKAKRWQKRDEQSVNRAAVLGAGIMGGGIAYQSAYKGVPIKMKDIAQKGLEQGLDEANRLLCKRVEKGKMTPKAMGEALNRIEPTLAYDGFDQVDMVVEAVVENAKVKRSVLAETEGKVSERTVLASNTSTISITALAEALKRPENFCGMHFFNPVHAMPLVEVIRGEKTSDQAIARTVAYATQLGKKPVVVNDCPGFLVNRVLFPYFAGFAMLVRDGVDYEHIDRVMERWGWPMGPAYLLDVVGLDTAVHAEQVMADAYPDRLKRDYTSCTEVLFDAGRLGQKSGGGFYDYEDDKKGRPQKQRSEQARESLGPLSNESLSDEEIVARMMIPMVTELVRCLDEAVVETAAEADMAMVYGTGFPPFRGGPLRWVDSLGPATLKAMAQPWESLSPLYQLPSSLDERARTETLFYPAPQQGGEK
ncbi:fatty acid oxidation complex subunit alpha FadB [Marinimicrobium agarilyticum]|uniref:fatty acid oxidation complex subunit alpha FadB n=1 Tax=Marinimicrobium agarilyticum TaxID=306546 RepID=UPI0004270D53|nr:fatty acid oxidation complex subunit alpha FadB [Marinimicrobium agarilyticum]